MSVLNAKLSNSLEGRPSFPLWHRAYRGAWAIVWFLFARWTPPPLFRWRNALLRLFGADIHAQARVYGSAHIWYPANLTMERHSVLGPNSECYCMDKVRIGEKAVISQGAQLCGGTHDISDRNFQLITAPISVGNGAWIAAEAFVGPGVSIGEFAVVGARAVLFKSAEPYGVYVGNPAFMLKTREFRSVG